MENPYKALDGNGRASKENPDYHVDEPTAQEKAARVGREALAKTYAPLVEGQTYVQGGGGSDPMSGNAVPLRAHSSMSVGPMAQNEKVEIELMTDGKGIHSDGPGEDYKCSYYKVNG